MTSAPRSGLPGVSERFYRQLLFLYPRSYRAEFGHKMARTFSDCCEIAFQENGIGGLIRLWLGTLVDLSSTVLEKHVEQGLLSSRLTAIRVICLGAMVGSILILGTDWDAENLNLLWASLLFAIGALGLFLTSPWVIDTIKQRGRATSVMGSRRPQARSISWAFAALAGLALVDFLDLALDAISGSSYVQPLVDQYGPVSAFLAGALPRLVFYLTGLSLYRRPSAWAIVPALLMAIPRASFSDGVIRALLAGRLTEYRDPFVDAAAILLAVAVALTGVWAVLDLRKARETS